VTLAMLVGKYVFRFHGRHCAGMLLRGSHDDCLARHGHRPGRQQDSRARLSCPYAVATTSLALGGMALVMLVG